MTMIENIFAPSPPNARYHFVCRTCATEELELKHEAVTRSRRYAYLCLDEHDRRGHDAEVLRVD